MISKIYNENDNRPSLLKDEFKQIGVDFDGVIHACSKGYHDGTIYDDPIPGSLEAVKRLASKYKVIVYTAKARHDRPLVNGKTGVELVWEWLKEKGFSKYISEVTAEKPRVVFYIDDRAIRFTDWKQTIRELNSFGIDIDGT
jgi:hypothetical protein